MRIYALTLFFFFKVIHSKPSNYNLFYELKHDFYTIFIWNDLSNMQPSIQAAHICMASKKVMKIHLPSLRIVPFGEMIKL